MGTNHFIQGLEQKQEYVKSVEMYGKYMMKANNPTSIRIENKYKRYIEDKYGNVSNYINEVIIKAIKSEETNDIDSLLKKARDIERGFNEYKLDYEKEIILVENKIARVIKQEKMELEEKERKVEEERKLREQDKLEKQKKIEDHITDIWKSHPKELKEWKENINDIEKRYEIKDRLKDYKYGVAQLIEYSKKKGWLK